MKPLYPMPAEWSAAPPDLDAIQAWQLACLEDAHAGGAGLSRLLVQAPCGTGKTTLAAKLAAKLQADGDARLVFLVPWITLADQGAVALRERGVDVAIEQGSRKARRFFGGRAPHVVATKDSLRPRRLEAFLGRSGLHRHRLAVACDECHLASSASYLAPVEGLKPFLVLGLTATPTRLDGKPLVGPGAPFEALLCRYDFLTACRHGVLVPPMFHECEGPIDLRGVKLTRLPQGKDYDPEQLRRKINDQLDHICNAARMEMESAGLKRVIFFAPDVGVAKAVERWFTTGPEGFPCRAVYGSLPDRDAVIRAYRDGHLRVIVSCQLLDVGFDDPPTDGLVMASPTNSPVTAIQRAGRGSRRFPGKSRYTIIGYRWEDDAEGPQSTLDILLKGVADEGVRRLARTALLDPGRRVDLLEAVDEAEIIRKRELEEERRRREAIPVVGTPAEVAYTRRVYDPMQGPAPSLLDPATVRNLVELGKARDEAAAMGPVSARAFLKFWGEQRDKGLASYKQVFRLTQRVAPGRRLDMASALALSSKQAQCLIWSLKSQGLCRG